MVLDDATRAVIDDLANQLKEKRALMDDKLVCMKEQRALMEENNGLLRELIEYDAWRQRVERVADSIRPGDDPCDIQRKLYACRAKV